MKIIWSDRVFFFVLNIFACVEHFSDLKQDEKYDLIRLLIINSYTDTVDKESPARKEKLNPFFYPYFPIVQKKVRIRNFRLLIVGHDIQFGLNNTFDLRFKLNCMAFCNNAEVKISCFFVSLLNVWIGL